MKKAIAVIGANYGDEGKGLMTDYLAAGHRKKNPVVVRFNGGAQAGHTVDTGYLRHIFHHFGSGTMATVPTYLGPKFICNPLLWETELSQLVAYSPAVMACPRCLVTTPYDMLINREVELHRGDGRHGSCGVGINETVERDQTGHFRLYLRDVFFDSFVNQVENIRRDYVPTRMKALGVLTDRIRTHLDDQGLFDHFITAARAMFLRMSMTEVDNRMDMFDTLIFEGAQGLLLDENNKDSFPHVTRGRTGLTNVVDIAYNNTDSVEAVYVTRPYMTRHGAGPFPTETHALRFTDSTNYDHPFQGRLRFGWLDLDVLNGSIGHDILFNEQGRGFDVSPAIAVTHLDEFPDRVGYKVNGELKKADHETFIADIEKTVGVPVKYVSYGSRRSDVGERTTKCISTSAASTGSTPA